MNSRLDLVLASVFATALATHAQNNPPTAGTTEEFSITTRGPHHRVWERKVVETRLAGTTITNTRSYSELATGLNFWDQTAGQWKESKEAIEPLPNGAGAAATQGQHKVIFPANINGGVIEMNLPNGQWLRSRVLGLRYRDADGRNVLIAEIKDSTGQIVGENQVVYPDAFTLRADVRYTYRKSGFEQDIILREQLPLPEKFGFDSKTTRLQVLTEFLAPPEPIITRVELRTPFGTMTDERLDFGAGTMKMVSGKAFPLGSDGASPAATAPKVPTGKQWIDLDGRIILVEEVPLPAVAAELDRLPAPKRQARLKPRRDSPLYVVSTKSLLPRNRAPARTPLSPSLSPSDGERVARGHSYSKSGIALAKREPAAPGFVLDYVTTVGWTEGDLTFQTDNTYYISGDVYLDGDLTIEGGSVLKFKEWGFADGFVARGDVDFQTSAARPAVITSMNDNTAGELIDGSTGTPGTIECVTLLFDLCNFLGPVQHLQIRYAAIGLFYWHRGTALRHCEFLNVYNGVVSFDLDSRPVQNVLFAGVSGFAMGNLGYPGLGQAWFIAEHLTVHNANELLHSAELEVKNSLFVGVANWGHSFTGDHNVSLSSDAGVFASAGPDAHYLAAGSIYRDQGTTDIDTDLLAEIQTMTTYAPQDGSFPDTDPPDLGYHFPILSRPVACATDEQICRNGSLYVCGYDPTGLPVTFFVVNYPAHGTLSYDAFGNFIYTPDNCFAGTDTFTYKVQNGYVDSEQVTVTVTVSDSVTANSGTLPTCKNTGISFNVSGSDSCSLPLTYGLVGNPPAHAQSFSLSSSGSVNYTPVNGYCGNDSFQFRAISQCGQASASAVMTITVGQPPTAYSDTKSTCKNTALNFNVSGSDPCADSFAFALVSGPAHGAAFSLSPFGLVSYTPANGYCGDDTFQFRVINQCGQASDPATVTIQVGDPNPVANCQDVMVKKDTSLAFSLSGSDTCGDTLIFAVVPGSGPNQAQSFSISANGFVTYTPQSGYVSSAGPDGFDFTVSNCRASAQGHVTLNVVPGPTLFTACRPDRINLRWAVPQWIIDQYGSGYIYDFRIYRCETTSGSCTPAVLYATVSDGSARSYTDTVVQSGKTYCYVITFRHRNSCYPPSTPEFYESPFSNPKCEQLCSPSLVLVSGNRAAAPNGGPIETYSFTDGTLVNSFVPDGATASLANGRGLAIYGNEVFYTELGAAADGRPFGPTDLIHVAPYGVQGSGGTDIRTLPNPRPETGIADLAYHNGALYVLTGYPRDPLQVYKLNPNSGVVIEGPISIGIPAQPGSDGFTVLPNGNFLINDGDADGGIGAYREYNGTTGAQVLGGLLVDLRNFGFFAGSGVATAPDGLSLYFMAWQGPASASTHDYEGSIVQTDLSGQLISFENIGRVGIEDIDVAQ